MYSRMIDDGVPMTLQSPRDPDLFFVVDHSICESMACTVLHFRVRSAQMMGDGKLLASKVATSGVLDPDSGAIESFEGGELKLAEPYTDASEWLQAELTSPESLLFMRSRRSRLRGQMFPPPVRPIADLEYMIPHDELFPEAWDLVFRGDDQTYALVDNHCLKPTCSCDDVTINIEDMDAPELPLVGVVRVSMSRFGKPEILEGDAKKLRRVWPKIRAKLEAKIRKRYREMRQLGKRQGRDKTRETEVSISSPVARNAPCPCGSDKKYKKCCGRGK